ncbi:MAG: chemotaxis response regulator protein-glutamate methylesterase [Candidatus Magasanikbacteria bacterium]|jgi:two-component system, chemotaxis family, protein-glutamate methylesterase/glutaminase|nr:chemotaxis response regulator protein-glutamate methylesterase [Candidatus Magasanikbacteria bacterium]
MSKSSPIRVLVVDDSFFMRKLLTELISAAPDMEVIGEAKNGIEAVGYAAQLHPDVITMDYNMPEMTGAEAVLQILALPLKKKPRIIMLSAYTTEGAKETFNSLRAGAVFTIQKSSGEISLDIKTIQEEIFSKIRQAYRAKVQVRPPLKEKTVSHKSPLLPAEHVVIIGSSTGGPPVVEDILLALPQSIKAPIIIVQHMPAFFTKTFAQRLDRLVPFDVKEAYEGAVLHGGSVYIAPGGKHLRLGKKNGSSVCLLTDEDPVHGLKPSIDVTMQSAAPLFKEKIIGIELTGMGKDGQSGMKDIKKHGGLTLVQNPYSAVIASMPQSVIDAGAADEILSPKQIAEKITSICS